MTIATDGRDAGATGARRSRLSGLAGDRRWARGPVLTVDGVLRGVWCRRGARRDLSLSPVVVVDRRGAVDPRARRPRAVRSGERAPASEAPRVTATRARLDAAEIAAVVALFVLGVALRCWRLDLGWFGVDQARDIQTALDIAAGRDWPTVGPTMRRVTSLGALYYYVWAVPALLSNDPLAAYRLRRGSASRRSSGCGGWHAAGGGTHSALVALAVFATSRVAVIDTRIAWAPAALPPTAVCCCGS